MMGHTNIMAGVSFAVVCALLMTGHAVAQSNPVYPKSPYGSADGVTVAPPLDHVSVEGTPYPTRGLSAYVPAKGTKIGQSSSAISQTGEPLEVSGRLLRGFGFGQGGGSDHARIKITPHASLPDHEQLGYTVSGWFRVPTNQAGVNPIIQLRNAVGTPKCSDVQEAPSTLSCPSGETIKSIQNAYYGQTFGGGQCFSRSTNACSTSPVDAVKQKCLNRASCDFTWPNYEFGDPCPNIVKRFMVTYTCAPYNAAPATSRLLYVNNSQDAKLHLEIGDGESLTSASTVNDGKWHHYAIVFKSSGTAASGGGYLTLFVDGYAEARSKGVDVATRFNEIEVGAVTLGARGAGQANVSNGLLGSHTDQDDILVYKRPLNEPEVRSLIDKTRTGLSLLLPPLDAAEYASANIGYGTTPTRANTSSTYRSTFKALTPPATGFALPVDAGGLQHTSSFTVGAWIYIDGSKPADGTTLLELANASGAAGIKLSTFFDSRVYKSSLKLVVRNTNDTSYTIEQYPFSELFPGTNRWSFVSFTIDQASGKASMYLDGKWLGETSTRSGTPFAGGDMTAKLGANLHLGWAGLYARALTEDEVMTQRSPGPTVWLDGQLHSGKPRDWADFHDHEEDDRRREGISLIKKSGDSPQRALYFDNQPNSQYATAVEIGAYSELDDETFSLFAHVEPGTLFFNQNKHIPLFYKYSGRGSIYNKFEFQSHIRCATYSACNLYIMAPDSANILRTYRTAFAIPANGPRIAMSYDGNTPTVAISGKLHELTRIDSGQPYAHTGQQAPSRGYNLRFGLFDDENSVSDLALREVRVYARPLSVVELEALGRTCSELSCEEQNQECFETLGAYNGTATCTTCSAGSFDSLANESQGGICTKKAGVFEECVGSSECAQGMCLQSYINASNPEASSKYYCASDARSGQCEQTCNQLNRDCEFTFGGLPGSQIGAGTGYTCGECKQYFSEPTEGDVSQVACRWTPTGETGDIVTSALGCKNGQIHEYGEPVFNVYSRRGAAVADKTWFLQNVWGRYRNNGGYVDAVNGTYNQNIKRCAPADCQECADLNRQCDGYGRCLPSCRQNYRQVWSMLSPSACYTAWKNLINDGIGAPNGLTPWWDGAVGHYLWMPHGSWEGLPTKEHINYMFRYDSGAFQPSDITALETIGVGPNYMKLVLDPNLANQFRARHPNKSLQIARCLAPDSVFRDPQFNFKTCVAVRNPNGSACPPPGEPSQGDNGDHQFCVSNFCARDTKICEKGTNNVEEAEGNNRNDNQSGKENTNFGIIHKNQTKVTASEGAPGSRRRAYTADSSNGAQAIFFGQSFDVFTINPSIQSRQNGAASVTSSFRILGVTIPTNSTPATSCAGAKWTNGSWTGSGECGLNLDKPNLSTNNKLCFPVAEDWIKKKSKSFTFAAGPVPITVKAAPTIDVCVSMISDISSSGAFSFGVKPAVGFGGDLRGGIGVEGPVVTAWAGIRAVLTVVEIGFPITWIVTAAQRKNAQGNPVPDLFEILYNAKIALEMEILSGFLSIFAEVGVGPFTTEWDLKVFEWKGFTFSKTLYEPTIKKTVLDFKYLLGNP